VLAFDEPGVGGELLDGGETADVMDFEENDKRQDLPDTGNASENGNGVLMLASDGAEDLVFDGVDDLVEVVHEGEVELDVLPGGIVREPICETLSIDLAIDSLAERREVVLAAGVLGVDVKLGSVTHEVVAAPKEISG